MAINYKTLNFSAEEINTLLNKANGSEVLTAVEKNKLTGLSNYDDTELRSAISGLRNYDDTAIKALISGKSETVHAHSYSEITNPPAMLPIDTIVTKDYAVTIYQPKLSTQQMTYISAIPGLDTRISAEESRAINYNDLIDAPTIPEVPDMSVYLTTADANTNYQTKLSSGDIINIGKISTLSTDVNSLKTKTINYSDIVGSPDLSVYTTTSHLTNYVTTSDLTNNYVTKADAQTTYATTSQLSGYVPTTSDKLLTADQKASISKISTIETQVTEKLEYKEMTLVEYNSLSVKNSNTLYIIVSV